MTMKRWGVIIGVLLLIFLQIYVLRGFYALKDAVIHLQEQDIVMTKVITKQAQVLTMATAKVVDMDQQINPPAASVDSVPEEPQVPSLSEQMNFTEVQK